jgi:hypothetical protein
MKIYNFDQGSTEWHGIRAGIPTTSEFSKIIKANGSTSDQVRNYSYQLVGERLLGRTEEGFKSDWMNRGTEMESEARELYEFLTDTKVDQVGFFRREKPDCGCSPDGLISEDGGLELKCPKLSTHIKYLRIGKLPAEYHRQVHGSLFVTGRAWWDFMSYYPGIKPFIIRVYPDKIFMDSLHMAIEELNKSVDSIAVEIGDK